MRIAILLSTYNGESYLEQQIDSIINQTNRDWRLYLRDDGSTDQTIAIIKRYMLNYPDQIIFVEDNLGNLKSAASFMHLLSVANADYYMFSDQDDIWHLDKIERSLSKLLLLELENKNRAALVFTNLSLVDSELKLISKSMWSYSKINPENAKDLYITACLSSVTGCTMMFNEILKSFVLPYPKEARMHDWWISLNAIHFGSVDYILDSTVLYRQHESNVLGAEKVKNYHYLKRLFSLNGVVRDNIRTFRMIKSLNFRINCFKFLYYKLLISLTR